jgi:hypothetical protein
VLDRRRQAFFLADRHRLPTLTLGTVGALGRQSGIDRRMNPSNMGTVNAVSPCWGL